MADDGILNSLLGTKMANALRQYINDASPGGLLNPEVKPGMPTEIAKGLLSFTPVVGDAISGFDALQAAKDGRYKDAGLNALGLLPFVPSLGGTTKLISSQRYLDDARVAQKMANKDFTVRLSPAFNVGGETLQVVEDGHHAMEAARRSGVNPNFIVQSERDNDRIGLLNKGKIDDFLEASYMDSPWYYIHSGKEVW